MHLGADMMRAEADDALAIDEGEALPGVSEPSARRSIHSRPSGFSITSATAGSSSHAAVPGPKGVRSIRATRAVVSALSGCSDLRSPRSCRGGGAAAGGEDWRAAGPGGFNQPNGGAVVERAEPGARSIAELALEVLYRRPWVTLRTVSRKTREGRHHDCRRPMRYR